MENRNFEQAVLFTKLDFFEGLKPVPVIKILYQNKHSIDLGDYSE